MAELFNSAGRTRITHFVQYLVAFCSRLDSASDVISRVAVDDVGTDVLVKCDDLLGIFDPLTL